MKLNNRKFQVDCSYSMGRHRKNVSTFVRLKHFGALISEDDFGQVSLKSDNYILLDVLTRDLLSNVFVSPKF